MLTPAAQATSGCCKGYMKTVITLDWGAINQRWPDWNIRWNKSIEL